jgi:SAM-dependent methyltransferase
MLSAPGEIQPALSRDATRDNVDSYRSSELPIFPAEEKILRRLEIGGGRVLDLGCGEGRITKWLVQRQADVYASDLSSPAVRALASEAMWLGGRRVVQADARSLPFESEAFRLVVFAFNGMDFLYPLEERRTALREVDRVLQPDGCFVFSSHNPVGTMLSPRGLRSMRHLRWRARYLATRSDRDRYVKDESGLQLYQAPPKLVISQVEAETNMRFVSAINRQGNLRSLRLIHLFSAWPYFVFRKLPVSMSSERR